MTPSQEAREYPPLPPLDDRDAVWKWALSTGVWREPFTLDGLIVMLRRALDSDRKARQQDALTDAQIAAGWESTFSTRNPFCPCDLRSFTKTVRWAEHAIRRAAIAKGEQSHE